MNYRRFNNIIMVRIEKGEEILDKLRELCIKENIRAGAISGIGASNDITIGLFKPDDKEYYSKNLKEDFEITNITGNISVMNNEPYLHVHGTFSNDKAECFGGHLNKAIISVTCEVVVTVFDGEIDRKFSDEIGINLIEF